MTAFAWLFGYPSYPHVTPKQLPTNVVRNVDAKLFQDCVLTENWLTLWKQSMHHTCLISDSFLFLFPWFFPWFFGLGTFRTLGTLSTSWTFGTPDSFGRAGCTAAPHTRGPSFHILWILIIFIQTWNVLYSVALTLFLIADSTVCRFWHGPWEISL